MSWFGFMTFEGATIIVLLMCFLDIIKYILCITFNDTTTRAPEMKYETIDSPPLNNVVAIICPAEQIRPAETICPSEPICPPEPMCLPEPECPSDPSLPPKFKSPIETTLETTTLTQDCPPEPKSEGTKHPVEANCKTIKDAPESIYPKEPIGSAGTICPSEPICPPEPIFLPQSECPSDPSHPPEFKGPIETTLEITTLTQDCLPEPKSEGTKQPVEANCETIKNAPEPNDEVKDITQSPEPKTEGHKTEGPYIVLSFTPESYCASEAAWKITMLSPEGLSKQKSEDTKHPAETNLEKIGDGPEPNGDVMNLPQLKQLKMEVTVDSIIPTWAPKPNCA